MSFLMVQRAPTTTGTVVVLSPNIRSTLCIIVIIIVLIIVILIVITFKSKTAATGKKITNHSSRKTCVQKLKNAGVPRGKLRLLMLLDTVIFSALIHMKEMTRIRQGNCQI